MKKTFQIKGMHCNSCAILIEKELQDKVNSISVSYTKGQAEIDFDKEKISEEEIISVIKKLGYEIVETKKNNDNLLKFIILGIAFISILFLIYPLFSNLNIPDLKLPEIGQNTSLILLFFIGILTSFHCISMCGGFVVSYTAKNALEGHKEFKQHLIYGGSKVLSYTIIGGVFGLIGGIFAFSLNLRGWVAILAGIFMIFYSLSMMGISFFKKFQFNPRFLTKIISCSEKSKGVNKRPMITGLLNGLFIACGPLQAMYLYAAGTGSFISGATSLFAFGLGTIPLMIGFGSIASAISHKTTTKILKISAVIVLILGLIMLNRGLTLTGSSYNFDLIKEKVFGNSDTSSITINNGIQEVNMQVTASGYSPNSFVLKKGVPVKWNVDVPQLFSCTNELIMNDYKIDFHLKQGLNIIEFTPIKTGTIQFTCGMGMLHGSFIVTDDGNASEQEINSAKPSSSESCNVGASCGCGM
ncbi:MAG: sulfite exporter TauE/SafE family protein [Candidatus Nanoarchaeia archaeon]|nr:sulfite exporter TauE/SafE family protein [Candidatus Nanoarchaeia archaeon]